MAQSDENEAAQLPVRMRRTACEDGSSRVERFVHCAVRGGSVPLDECSCCPRLVSTHFTAHDGLVECTGSAPRSERPARVDVAEAAARTLVGELVAREVACVTSSAPLEAAAALLEEGAGAVPVVGPDGKLRGVVCSEQLLRLGHEGGWATLTAADAMIVPSHVLAEASPLSIALALLADARERALPVVSETGAVVGVLSGRDVVRWLARTVGYESQRRR
ncbi:MAG TPA: CBS domain-containing protein [Polyangiaceae bacterium]|jgi:CBS domain-containing protein